MSLIRVLVVDDSVVVRRLVTDALASDPRIEVIGSAANGQIALAKVEQHDPDLITMDIEMPVMNGIDAVRELRRLGRRTPIVMFSTLTERGAAATLDALSAGASDYVTKPANVGSVHQSIAQVREQLIPRIKALVPQGAPRATAARTAPSGARPATAATRGSAAPALRPRPEPHPVRAVVVGSSTGGPEALSRVLSGLSRPLPVPVLVVQHMPPVFTRQLAARLDRVGPSTVVEAAGSESLEAGTVYIAPGEHHLAVGGTDTLHTQLTQAPAVNFCRPSVDVLFRSAVRAFGGDLLAVMLTGMGSDGRSGSTELVEAGGTLIAQDEETSVVWGMPGAVTIAGLTHLLLPLDDVAQTVQRIVTEAPAAARRRPMSSGARP